MSRRALVLVALVLVLATTLATPGGAQVPKDLVALPTEPTPDSPTLPAVDTSLPDLSQRENAKPVTPSLLHRLGALPAAAGEAVVGAYDALNGAVDDAYRIVPDDVRPFIYTTFGFGSAIAASVCDPVTPRADCEVGAP